MNIEEKSKLIINDIKEQKSVNPHTIFKNIAQNDYINMHGPEHHVLDGAGILVAYKNAGGDIDLDDALLKLKQEGLRMPGAMCGLWGVCGAITSIGAALSIIDGTGPLSNDGTWGDHMEFIYKAIKNLGEVNGPRCCKRDAQIAFKYGVEYINCHYDTKLEYDDTKCEFSSLNMQCIKDRCPFYE